LHLLGIAGGGAVLSVEADPHRLRLFVKAEIAKWAPVVKASGARVD
jgi:hypothetical protein